MAPHPRGSRPRHVPQRTCIACRQTGDKRGLVRVVRGVDATVSVDPTGKRNGRGAYLCHSPECWRNALQHGILPRALKIDTVSEVDLQQLTEYADGLSAEKTSAPE